LNYILEDKLEMPLAVDKIRQVIEEDPQQSREKDCHVDLLPFAIEVEC
jgi:hypothetical protein